MVTRIKWANWRHQHFQQQAVRLHIKLRLADLQSGGIEISEGKICERAAMRRLLKPGEFYLGDRNYGADHSLFAQLDEIGCGYVLRLRNESTWEVIENHPLTPAAVAGGIALDILVRLGGKGAGGIRRIIILRRPEMKEDLILVTSSASSEMKNWRNS